MFEIGRTGLLLLFRLWRRGHFELGVHAVRRDDDDVSLGSWRQSIRGALT